MRNLDQINNETGIYFLHNKEGCLLYAGKATSTRARLRQHERNYHIVKSWLSFFDLHFENLNLRIREAARQSDEDAFNTLSARIAWPLALINSTLAIDCAFGSVDTIKIEKCLPQELDQKECVYVQSLRPPFNYQYNTYVPDSLRWKYFPRDYLKSKALSNLHSHYNRLLTMQRLG
ncbi:MAG TPA: GIY-YIG nuclease family protein [Candidatus Angelobacter sp.]|nr:GIY-YIG nuclease family protein [Candidatus Angelobacter sp.]